MAAQHTIVLTPELFERVQRLANEQHRSPELVVHQMLEEHFADLDGYSCLHQDADKAIENFKRTGLHATFEEVDEWLGKLAAGERVPPPKCHT
ncbi:MAG: CopG family transcriptional regulator [Acidobacteria bacterium]|nr:CopG family transcriptional regulator [Acidobacteriota bacterium]